MKFELQFEFWFDGVEDASEDEVTRYIKEIISEGADMAAAEVNFSYVKRIE